MNVLGVSSYFHDAAACLAIDGAAVAALEEERLSRRKHDSAFPRGAIDYCLSVGAVGAKDIDAVCFYEKPLLKLERVVEIARGGGVAHGHYARRQVEALGREGLDFERQFREAFKYSGPIWYIEHHLAHAASAYLASPYERSTILTVDGVGEWATTAIHVGRSGDIEPIEEIHYPDSLGLLYSTVTAFLGFAVNNDEYKVMGLAAYGKPRYLETLGRVVEVRNDGSFALDQRYFEYARSGERMHSEAFEELLGSPRVPGTPVTDRDRDLASSIQRLCEEIYLGLARRAKSHEPAIDNLCLAGGVALNGVANERIIRESGFRNVFIQPAAGDGGGAMGAALWASRRLGAKRRLARHTTRLGKSYSDGEVQAALEQTELDYRCFDREVDLLERVASLLADGKIVGWCQGRSEFGPRALGARSILADPRRSDMQRILNARIKFREEFRPFAPAVLAERAAEWFELEGESPFMLRVCPVREERRLAVPAVTHVDGSARPQTVSKDDNGRFYALIKAFEAKTGVPMVINTSFNVRGEPIVESPLDACNCFLNSEIDHLAVGDFLASKLI